MSEELSCPSLLASYSRIEPILRSQVERITHDKHVTEDILQEALTRCLRKSTTEHIQSPEAWLRRVTYNLAVDYFRLKKPKPLAEENSRIREASTSEEVRFGHAGHTASGLNLEQMVQSLPSHYAKILVLRYRDGMGYKEIAERLQIPAGSAKNMACRAKSQLRTRFRERENSPN